MERILSHLGMPTGPPPAARARNPSDDADDEEQPGELELALVLGARGGALGLDGTGTRWSGSIMLQLATRCGHLSASCDHEAGGAVDSMARPRPRTRRTTTSIAGMTTRAVARQLISPSTASRPKR